MRTDDRKRINPLPIINDINEFKPDILSDEFLKSCEESTALIKSGVTFATHRKNDTITGIKQAVDIKNGNIPMHEVPNMPAKTYRCNSTIETENNGSRSRELVDSFVKSMEENIRFNAKGQISEQDIRYMAEYEVNRLDFENEWQMHKGLSYFARRAVNSFLKINPRQMVVNNDKDD